MIYYIIIKKWETTEKGGESRERERERERDMNDQNIDKMTKMTYFKFPATSKNVIEFLFYSSEREFASKCSLFVSRVDQSFGDHPIEIIFRFRHLRPTAGWRKLISVVIECRRYPDVTYVSVCRRDEAATLFFALSLSAHGRCARITR